MTVSSVRARNLTALPATLRGNALLPILPGRMERKTTLGHRRLSLRERAIISGAAAKAALADPANDLFPSAASVWGLATKIGNKKLSLSDPLDVDVAMANLSSPPQRPLRPAAYCSGRARSTPCMENGKAAVLREQAEPLPRRQRRFFGRHIAADPEIGHGRLTFCRARTTVRPIVGPHFFWEKGVAKAGQL